MQQFDVGVCDISQSLDPLKALFEVLHNKSLIILFTDGRRAGKAFLRLNRRKFRMISTSTEYDIRSCTFTGRAVTLWAAKHADDPQPLSNLFCRSDGDSHLRMYFRDKTHLNLENGN